MEPTVTPTPPKSPQDFTLAHFLDRVDRSAAEVRDAAHQPDVAAHQPDVARPGLHEMADPDLGELIRPRVSRGFVLFLILFSICVSTGLAWHWYGDAARAMIATSLAPEPAPVPQTAPEQTTAAPEATAAPELQQLKEDLAQLKQELQQLKEMPAALASLRQNVDQLAGSQQQMAGKIAKLSAQKPASPPRPTPAPKSLTPPSASKPLTPLQAEAR